MRISISAKIFVGFLVVLATFGGVATYGLITMRRLGKELRLVSRGYLELRLEVSELVSQHSNLIELLSEQAAKAEEPRVPPMVKNRIDLMRGNRLKRKLPQVLGTLATLERLELSPEEHALLAGMRGRLEKVQTQWVADEKLFDRVYGPLGEEAVEKGDPALLRG